MSNCIFCKIIAGEEPSFKVFENNNTYVFMSNANDVDGHILVIPKKHYKNIFDCDTDVLNSIMETTKLICDHLKNDCDYDGVNILNASDESAGQSVPHFHLHLIPRKNGDGVNTWPDFGGAKHDFNEVFNKIRLQ